VDAPDHVTATAVNQRATGAGVSAQALTLLEVDAWVRHDRITVVEVHPEVSYRIAQAEVHAPCAPSTGP
jgi:hypothetical protein